jgi:hypothetical protein
MTIVLNHTIVPAHKKLASARFFATLFGLPFDEKADHFAPVKINDTLTLLFAQEGEFGHHHYAFHVSEAEFDAIFSRVRQAWTTASSMTGTADEASISGILTGTCSN